MGAARRADSVTYDVVDGRAILVDPQGAELITLNPVGTMVWEALDGRRDVRELAEHLAGRLDHVDLEQARTDVTRFMDELRQLGLITE